MKLYFDITKIPRTTPRAQWREMWRRKRITEQALTANEAKMLDAVREAQVHLATFGFCAVRTQFINDTIEHLINPPLLLWPDQ